MINIPEIVEVQIQTEGLQKVVGDRIIGVELSDKGDKIVRPLSFMDLSSNTVGTTIEDVFRVGKYIVFQLEKSYMLVHLRMTGRWLLDVPEENIGHTRVTFKLESGRTLRYSDVRVFGRISFGNPWELKHGEDVWNADYGDLFKVLFNNQKVKDKTIKRFILDQKVLCGLGNVYANEALFHARIHPGSYAAEILNDYELASKLIGSIKETLYKGYKFGGLSLKDYYHVDGTRGSAQDHLDIYQATQCGVCLGKVERSEIFDGRASYYCPKCQK